MGVRRWKTLLPVLGLIAWAGCSGSPAPETGPPRGDLPSDLDGPADADPGTCSGEFHAAERVGLDLFVLLDVSGSMLDLLPAASLRAGHDTTKWDAVKQSLEAFVEAPESAGTGVGLHYFPQLQPGVPDSCTENAECGAGGPCTASVCVAGLVADDPSDEQPAVAFIGPTQPDCVGDDCICANDADCGGNNARCLGMTGVCVTPGQGVPQLPVPPLCNTQSDCAGIPGTNCESVGLCSSSGRVCVASFGCPAAEGSCVPYVYRCASQTSCESELYAAPAVPLATGMDHAAQLIQSLEGVQLRGLAATGPALRGALDRARAWALAHPDRRVVTVLATGGMPADCTPLELPEIAQIAASESSGSAPVRTFVIGVFSASALGGDGPARLDTLARAGGTARAFVIDTGADVAAEFLEALSQVRDTAASCTFQLGPQALDFDQVNLRLSELSGSLTDLSNVGDATACGDEQGWYYARSADGTPTQIETCPSTCARIETVRVNVELQVGCATRIR
jgi:hypothetical protein